MYKKYKEEILGKMTDFHKNSEELINKVKQFYFNENGFEYEKNVLVNGYWSYM